MALTTRDVITVDFVRDTVEEIMDDDLVYRQAFRDIDATGIQSNAYQFNIAEDDMGRVRMVPEGAEVPRHQNTIDTVTVNFDKFAGEISITMEAQEDSLLDMKAREVEDLGRAMDETLNYEAFSELRDATEKSVGQGDNHLDFEEIRDAIIAVREDNYQPDTLFLDLHAYGDLLTDDYFNNAPAGGSQGENVVATGEIGEIAGLNVVIDNAHDIGSGGHGAYLVDTNNFGYELSRTPMASREYEDDERMADIIQVYTRRTWKSIFSDASVMIDG